MRKTRSWESEVLLQHRALLAALSDDLALPLVQIKTGLELMAASQSLSKSGQGYLESVSLSTNDGLQLIEAYRLALRAQDPQNLPLEPVAVGALLQDVADRLSPYARLYSTNLEIDVQGRLTPVLAHSPSLIAALQCLGASLIRAQAAQSKKKNYRLMLAAHRGSDNLITTGAFSNVVGLSDRTLRSARSLAGHARQPLPVVSAGAASGILIADMLCSAMWQPLRATAHRNLSGLATVVPITKQLNLV